MNYCESLQIRTQERKTHRRLHNKTEPPRIVRTLGNLTQQIPNMLSRLGLKKQNPTKEVANLESRLMASQQGVQAMVPRQMAL
jgi:hypothetical protein